MKRRDWIACSLAFVAVLVGAVGWSSPPVVTDSPFLIAASTSGVAITVDASCDVTIYHTGKTTAGAAASGLVVIGWGTNPTAADYTIESNKLLLENGGVVRVPRGQATLYVKSATGAPVMQIIQQSPAR